MREDNGFEERGRDGGGWRGRVTGCEGGVRGRGSGELPVGTPVTW